MELKEFPIHSFNPLQRKTTKHLLTLSLFQVDFGIDLVAEVEQPFQSTVVVNLMAVEVPVVGRDLVAAARGEDQQPQQLLVFEETTTNPEVSLDSLSIWQK
jgi:hypothetical protein